MKKVVFTGAGVAIITPMNNDGSVNYEMLGTLIDWQIENSTDAIIVCGTTGEASTLTDDEHVECTRFAVERANKRVPVIAGTGSNDTVYSLFLAEEAKNVALMLFYQLLLITIKHHRGDLLSILNMLLTELIYPPFYTMFPAVPVYQ